MNERRDESLQVYRFYKRARIPMGLCPVSGRTGFSRTIEASSVSTEPGSVRLWGKSEIQKMKGMSPRQRKVFILKELQGRQCLILTEGLSFPRGVRQLAKEKRIALFTTELSKRKSRFRLNEILSTLAVPKHVMSGGLLNIFKQGVLIMGDSGIGKSESALELISRGHLFISDDVVQIQKGAGGKLVGSATAISRHFMEIRGLGIINIQKIFGDRSIRSESKIDLIIMLKRWKAGMDYDRLGLKFPESQQILGVDVPKITIPVAPGRNIASLIEVACKVFILKRRGYHAAREITEKLDRALDIQ